MASQALSPRARRELAEILAEDRREPAAVLAALRRIRETEEAAPFAAAVEALLRVQLREPEAERVLTGILDHRAALAAALGRDPGLRVAAADYYFASGGGARGGELWEAEGDDMWDAATGLPGARAFAAELAREIRRSRRHGLVFALVRLRCDGFLGARHSHGPLLADELARQAGQTVRRALREADRAGRLSERELGLLLPETDRLGARMAAERVLAALIALLAQRFPADGLAVPPIAAGASCFPEDGGTAELLRERAAAALQRACARALPAVVVHPHERRGHPRHSLPAGLRVRVRSEADARAARGSALDASRSGVLVEVREGHLTLERVALDVSRPDDETGAPFAIVVGRIVRAAAAAEPSSGARVGVAFDAPLAEGWWSPSAKPGGAR